MRRFRFLLAIALAFAMTSFAAATTVRATASYPFLCYSYDQGSTAFCHQNPPVYFPPHLFTVKCAPIDGQQVCNETSPVTATFGCMFLTAVTTPEWVYGCDRVL